MSQPTLSRLENLAGWRALARIGLGGSISSAAAFARPPTRIVLDIDDTDDPVHGQQGGLFNAHYDCTCLQPTISSTASRASRAVAAQARQAAVRGETAGAWRNVVGASASVGPGAAGDPRARRQPLLQRARAGAAGSHALAITSSALEIAAPWREQCDLRRSRMKPTVRRFHQLPSALASRPVAQARRPCRSDGARHQRPLRG